MYAGINNMLTFHDFTQQKEPFLTTPVMSGIGRRYDIHFLSGMQRESNSSY